MNSTAASKTSAATVEAATTKASTLPLHTAAVRPHAIALLILERLLARLSALHILPGGLAIARAAQCVVAIHVLRALIQIAGGARILAAA